MANGISPQEKNPIFLLGITAIGLILIFSTIAIAYNYGLFTSNLETPIEGQKPTIIYGQAQLNYRIITSSQWKAIGVGSIVGVTTLIFAPVAVPLETFAASSIMGAIGVGSVYAGVGAVGGGLLSGLFGQNHLTISTPDVNEVQPYSMSIAPLFLGSGPVKCAAQLVTADGRVADQTSKTIQPFGGVGEPKTAFYTFRLRAYSSETYKVIVACRDTNNPNSAVINQVEYTTFAKK